jgi:L-threonylcarbamoyladenylate synthase
MKAVVERPNQSSIARAAASLRAGELIAFPTETVYGLGADASRPEAVRKIFNAKGRPVDHPVIVHLYDAGELANWTRTVPSGAQKLAASFWPGPLTLILPRAPSVADAVTGGQDTVGIRVPSHPVARALLAEFGTGIAAPSANRFGRISPTTAQHVAEDLGDAVSIILDGGPCTLGIESTIVGFAGDEPMLLRPGAVGIADLERVLGRAPCAPTSAAPRAPGTLAAHYAPKTPATLVPPGALHAELEQFAERDEVIAVLARTVTRPPEFSDMWIDAPSDAAAYAHDLYANLRKLDNANADAILVETVPAGDEWLAVRDRLGRATRGEDDDRD